MVGEVLADDEGQVAAPGRATRWTGCEAPGMSFLVLFHDGWFLPPPRQPRSRQPQTGSRGQNGPSSKLRLRSRRSSSWSRRSSSWSRRSSLRSRRIGGAASFTGTNSRLLPRRHRCWAPQPHSPAHARCPAGDSGVALTPATRAPRRCRAFRSLQLHHYGLAGC
jgi:hypothetical protein